MHMYGKNNRENPIDDTPTNKQIHGRPIYGRKDNVKLRSESDGLWKEGRRTMLSIKIEAAALSMYVPRKKENWRR